MQMQKAAQSLGHLAKPEQKPREAIATKPLADMFVVCGVSERQLTGRLINNPQVGSKTAPESWTPEVLDCYPREASKAELNFVSRFMHLRSRTSAFLLAIVCLQRR